MILRETMYLCKTPKDIEDLVYKLKLKGFMVVKPLDLNKPYVFFFRQDTLCVDYISYEGYKNKYKETQHSLVIYTEGGINNEHNGYRIRE